MKLKMPNFGSLAKSPRGRIVLAVGAGAAIGGVLLVTRGRSGDAEEEAGAPTPTAAPNSFVIPPATGAGSGSLYDEGTSEIPIPETEPAVTVITPDPVTVVIETPVGGGVSDIPSTTTGTAGGGGTSVAPKPKFKKGYIRAGKGGLEWRNENGKRAPISPVPAAVAKAIAAAEKTVAKTKKGLTFTIEGNSYWMNDQYSIERK